MGTGAQARQTAPGGDQPVEPQDHQEIRSGQTRRPARKRRLKQPIPPIGEEFAKSLLHFFPSFPDWLDRLADGRCAGKTDYPKALCIWAGLAIFLQGLGSRRQFDRESDADIGSDVLLHNLNSLAGTRADDIPHGDTVADCLSLMPHQDLERLLPKMVGRVIRMRVLEYTRLLGRYLIAIDATGLWVFHRRHCRNCLTQSHNGKTVYYHLVIAAKLVTPDGLCLPVAAEFIENSDPTASKQDCEKRAIMRLMKKLKQFFPRLPICLLLDALHANGPVFDLCRESGWDWIATLKKGSLPTVWDEFCRLKSLAPENVVEKDVDGRYQRLAWIAHLQHEGHRLSALDCLTYNRKHQIQYFAWITNLPVNWTTAVSMANQGGRTRWKIENQGFKQQKRHGYELEHVYSENETAGKNYYFLLQVAHILVQLLVRGTLARPFKVAIKSLKNFFIRMADSLRHRLISPIEQIRQAACSMQIRLDSS